MDGCYNCVRAFDGTVYILCPDCHKKRTEDTTVVVKRRLEETVQWLKEQ